MATPEQNRIAKALEGILGQMTFLVGEARKTNEIMSYLRPLRTESGEPAGVLYPPEFKPWQKEIEALMEGVLAGMPPETDVFPWQIQIDQFWRQVPGEVSFRGVAIETATNDRKHVTGTFTEDD